MLKIKSFEFNPIQENTYLLYNEFNYCAIIDPGCYYEEEYDQLFDFVKANDLRPVMLLNTHCHLDHVFGNKKVAAQYSLTLQLHENEKAVLNFAPTSGLMYNLPFDNYTGNFIWLNDGDQLAIGDDKLTVLLTPGHSPGSLSFYCQQDAFVISGDALFKGSIGRTDLPGGNYAELIKSIKEKLMVLPAETKVYSGHGPATVIGEEANTNPYLL